MILFTVWRSSQHIKARTICHLCYRFTRINICGRFGRLLVPPNYAGQQTTSAKWSKGSVLMPYFGEKWQHPSFCTIDEPHNGSTYILVEDGSSVYSVTSDNNNDDNDNSNKIIWLELNYIGEIASCHQRLKDLVLGFCSFGTESSIYGYTNSQSYRY